MIGIASTVYTATEIRENVAALRADSRTRQLLDWFQRLWYDTPHTWAMTYWQGVPTMKCPMDLWTLQDVIFGMKPALIIETGTALGGSALFYAQMCDLNRKGAVISVDLEPNDSLPEHPRLTFVRGASSTDPRVIEVLRARILAAEPGPVFVFLDSDHTEAHVAQELVLYEGFVGRDGLLVVEDTNINGHPVLPEFGPGPHEAVDAFLLEHPEWKRDTVYERYLMTMHEGGWLRRVRA